MSVDDPRVPGAVGNIDEADKERDFVVFVQRIPELFRKRIDIVIFFTKFYGLRIAPETGQRIAVRFICVDEMPFPGRGDA